MGIYHKVKEPAIRRKWRSGVDKSPVSAPTVDLRPICRVVYSACPAEVVVYGRTENVAPDIQESAEQMARDELPSIQQGEDLNVEDIPF